MNLESKHATAIKRFLDLIGYKEWCNHVSEVVAIMPGMTYGTKEETHLGTANFRDLADSINYLDCLERTT